MAKNSPIIRKRVCQLVAGLVAYRYDLPLNKRYPTPRAWVGETMLTILNYTPLLISIEHPDGVADCVFCSKELADWIEAKWESTLL